MPTPGKGVRLAKDAIRVKESWAQFLRLPAPAPFVSSEVEKRVRTPGSRFSTSNPWLEVYPERLPWQAVEGLEKNGRRVRL